MKAVDPFGYSHICDHAASYHPRRKSRADPLDWATVTDMTGRGYKNTGVYQYQTVRDKRACHRVNAGSLDQGNRFFDDNKRLYQIYGSSAKKPINDENKSLNVVP